MNLLASACTLVLCYDLFQIVDKRQCPNGTEVATVRQLIDMYMSNDTFFHDMVIPVQPDNSQMFYFKENEPVKFALMSNATDKKPTHIACTHPRMYYYYTMFCLLLLFIPVWIVVIIAGINRRRNIVVGKVVI